jgi:hypothetical protein
MKPRPKACGSPFFFSKGLFACLLLLLSADFAGAHHLMGGEITYTNVGGGRFSIMLKVYRDCSSGGMTITPITVTPLNCSGSSFTKTLPQRSVSDITPLCATVPSKCGGGAYPYGVQEYLYQDTIDLSSYTVCCQFNISWMQTRSSTITTTSTNSNLYLFTVLNKCLINSSPVLLEKFPLLCAGTDICYNVNAIDSIDHDSLSYSFDHPMISSSQGVTYKSGYSFDKPFMFLGFPNKPASLPAGFHLDASSGDMCFRPTSVQVTVVVIKVTEWRIINGVATNVGETRREMAAIVTACSVNKLPTVGSFAGTTACVGQNICTEISSFDNNPADTVLLSWDNGIPGATFTPYFASGSIKQKAIFCWTPSVGDTGANPHILRIWAKDNGCPENKTSFRSFGITVKLSSTVTASRQVNNLGCGLFSFDATPSLSGPFVYNWVIRSSAGAPITGSAQKAFAYKFSKGGTYLIDFSIGDSGLCPTRYSDTIIVADFLNVTLPADTSLCKGQAFLISSNVSMGRPPYKYQWSTGPNDTLATLNVVLLNQVKYYLTVTDSMCLAMDSILVSPHFQPAVSAGPDKTACIDGSAMVIQGVPSGGSWSGPGVSGNIFNPGAAGTGIQTLIYTFYSAGGCAITDTMLMDVRPLPPVNGGADTSVCLNAGAITLTGSPSGGLWSGPGVSGNILNPAGIPGQSLLLYRYTDSSGCNNTDSVIFSSKPIPSVFAGNDQLICRESPVVTLSGNPSGGTWTGTGMSADKFDPAIAGGGVHTITYRITDSSGCSNQDHVDMRVRMAVAVFTSVPDSGVAPLTVNFSDLSSVSHSPSWDFGDPYDTTSSNVINPEHIYSKPGIYSVRLAIKMLATIGCTDTLTKVDLIVVSPAPPPNSVNIPGSRGKIEVYPNPASGKFEVLLNSNEERDLCLAVFDLSGKKVKQIMQLKPGRHQVDCVDLKPGIYFLEVSGSADGILRHRIILN